MKNRFEGAILGLAIGDALGRPTEFISSLADLRNKFGPEGVQGFEPDCHPAGTYTDDTQMSLAVARALIEAGNLQLDELMPVMAREFVVWSKSPDNDRAPGKTCLIGCHNLEAGVPWQESGVAESKGCGSAMRAAPIGLYYYDNETKLIEVSRASSLPTHGHPTALASTAAAALAVAWALRGESPDKLLPYLAKRLGDMDGSYEMLDLVNRIPTVLNNPPDDVLRAGVLGEAWCGDEAVAGALYCFLRSPTNYRETVLTDTNTVGDSDSIACIAGGISGAYNGIEAIPQPWRQNVENATYLTNLSHNLFTKATMR